MSCFYRPWKSWLPAHVIETEEDGEHYFISYNTKYCQVLGKMQYDIFSSKSIIS